MTSSRGRWTLRNCRLEVDHLAGSQAELRRHVDHLLDRRESLGARVGRLRARTPAEARHGFSAADAEQLETRRAELEQQRFELVEQLRTHQRVLSELRDERVEVERQRAALLSARSIEHVQRELAAVQQKLEQAAVYQRARRMAGQCRPIFRREASDFLAQLTDGGLVRLTLVEHSGRACVVNRAGETVPVDSLTAAERDQVYLSLCLALLAAASRQGVWLPLVLDEPFERLDARGTAALAAVLDDFGRQGHQVLVFTGRQAAAARWRPSARRCTTSSSCGSDQRCDPGASATRERPRQSTCQPTRKRKTKRQSTGDPSNRRPRRSPQPLDGQMPDADRSDAA